jgi:hypothetical protein
MAYPPVEIGNTTCSTTTVPVANATTNVTAAAVAIVEAAETTVIQNTPVTPELVPENNS